VCLTLKRIPVDRQMATDTIEGNLVIDLDFKDIKPVITYSVNENNPRLITFSGMNSLGNIDWRGARWFVYADGSELHAESGVSSFAYTFPESGKEVSYSVALTVPR
jgi:hypothetical protein